MRSTFLIAAVAALILSVSETMAASGPEDVVVLPTDEFVYACGLMDKGYGNKVILEKSFIESDAGQNLLNRFLKCQEAYQLGRPGDAPGKPEALLEALRRHSIGQKIWGDARFIDGDRYIAVTTTVKPVMENAPLRGNWGCIDYEGNVVIPLKYGDIVDGNTDLDAIVFETGIRPEDIKKIGVLHNDGSVALEAEYEYVGFPFGRWILTVGYHNTKDGHSIYDRNYRKVISGMQRIQPSSFTIRESGEQLGFFVIKDGSGLQALFKEDLQRFTDFKFREWATRNPIWIGVTGVEKDVWVDIRTWEYVDKL